MSVSKNRRLKVIGYTKYRLSILLYLLRTGNFRMAYSFLFVCLFSRDSGLALLDPFWRTFPKWNPYPWSLEVETTTRCHLKCAMCEHTYWNEKPRDMSFDQFRHIIDQFPGLKWIGMTGIGSSYLNKDFPRMLEYVKQRHCYVELFDSFDLIGEKEARALIDLEIDKVWVSMEAATKATYETIRVGAKFERTLENIRRFVGLKVSSRKPLPELWFHFIVSKLNRDEVMAYVDLVKDLVGDTRKHGTLIFWSALLAFDQVNDLRATVPETLKEQVDARCKALNIYSTWNLNLSALNPVTRCMRWTEPFVLVSGNVQCCCAINEANQRNHQVATSFGDLLHTPFQDLWYSNRYSNFIKTIRSGKLPACCKYCRVFRET